MLSGLLLIIALTTSALQSSKTATGSVSFNFDAPSFIVDNNFNLFYTNDGMTYGSGTSVGQPISEIPAFNVGVDENSQLPAYYIKVRYEFGEPLLSASFGNSTINVGNTTMGSMISVDSEGIAFESVSQGAITNGATVNIFEYLQSFYYRANEDKHTTTPMSFNITVTADTSSSFESAHRGQLTYSGALGFEYSAQPLVNIPAQANNIILINNFVDNNFVGTNVSGGDIVVDISETTTYLRFTVTSSSALYAQGTVQGSANGYNYVATTTSSGTTFNITSQNKVDTSNGQVQINLGQLLQNLPAGSFVQNMNDVQLQLQVYYSTDGDIYKTIDGANATIKINVVNTLTPPSIVLDSNAQNLQLTYSASSTGGAYTYDEFSANVDSASISLNGSNAVYLQISFSLDYALNATSVNTNLSGYNYDISISNNTTQVKITSQTQVNGVVDIFSVMNNLLNVLSSASVEHSQSTQVSIAYSFDNSVFTTAQTATWNVATELVINNYIELSSGYENLFVKTPYTNNRGQWIQLTSTFVVNDSNATFTTRGVASYWRLQFGCSVTPRSTSSNFTYGNYDWTYAYSDGIATITSQAMIEPDTSINLSLLGSVMMYYNMPFGESETCTMLVYYSFDNIVWHQYEIDWTFDFVGEAHYGGSSG